MPTLKNWGVTSDPYDAPELGRMQLKGQVYGHPKHEDGSFIRTSLVVRTEGRRVYTNSGTEYLLEDPHPEYVKWCEEKGYRIDPNAPVKLIRIRDLKN